MLVKHPGLTCAAARPYKQALYRYSGVTLSLSKGGSQMRIDTLPAREGESE